MKLIFSLLLLLTSTCFAQSDEQEIRKILASQTAHWNKGDIEGFMQGYWKSDSLMFVGKSGVTYGYTNTLNNYKRSYVDTVHMGKLDFDILKVEKLSADHYFVLGRWKLTRTVGNLGGHYTLIFRKINGKWTIVSDHSS